MFNVLQARGIPSRFVMFPDENHVRVAPYTPVTYILGYGTKGDSLPRD